jgi:hypothetical protein
MKGEGSFDPVNRVCTTDRCPDPTEFVCPSTGFFADPNDCHGFYVCDENLKANPSSCTAIAHFDPQRICVMGSCSQPSNTTAAFRCTAEGYFADPTDCRSYYECDSDLNAVHGICMGGGGHFDPDSEGCYAGKC